MQLADTPPEMRRRQLDVYRAMTPQRRVEQALTMSEEMLCVAVGGIRSRNPAFDDAQVRAELLRILHGDPRGRQDFLHAPGAVTLAELLSEMVRALDAAGIPHMVAGSLASTHHGEPRSTQDIDLVVDPSPASLAAFVAGLDRDRFYVGDAHGALDRRDQFNVIDAGTGWKVDLIIRKDRPFSRSEFARRLPVVIAGVETAIASVEDTILAKLEWARAGGSDRQRRDVVAMLAVQRDTVDTAYLQEWAEALGLTHDLQAAVEEAVDDENG